MDLRAIQAGLAERFAAGDRELGLPFLVGVLQEEVGELARAVRKGSAEGAGEEAVDVLFLALSVCNVAGCDAEATLRRKFLDRPRDEVARSWEPGARRAHGLA